MDKNSLPRHFFKAFNIAAVLFFGFVLIVAKFSVQIDWPRDITMVEKGVYLNRFFADFFIYAALFLLLYGRPLWSKILAWVMATLFTAVFLVQEQSYGVTGGFLPFIALENAQHSDFLDTDQHTLAAVIWAILLFLSFRMITLVCGEAPNLKSRIIIALILVFIGTQIKNDKHWLSEDITAQRFEFYNSGRPGIRRISPIRALSDSIDEYQEYLQREKWVANATVDLTEEAARLALDSGLPYAELDSEYALMQAPETLDPISFITPRANSKPMNVVVIFAEGISARNMQPYSDFFPGLFPNVAEFAESATVVENYYNHSFATYRGLSGQLCSLYAVGRLLSTTDYHCLGHELSRNGYQTRFMISQSLNRTGLDEVARRAGFDDADGAESLGKLLGFDEGEASEIITDKQLFSALKLRMNDYIESDEGSPFAIGVYNFETHTGIKLFESDVEYTNENVSRSDTLDTFHNFDKVFGDFWSYFKESPLFDNTIVVLTSDHATFPSREYKALVQNSPGYTPIFVDQIPFLIYHPNGKAQVAIDAKRTNSTNFTPSLLHLMNIQVGVNSFIGKSIFEKDLKPSTVNAGRRSEIWAKNDVGTWLEISDENRHKLPKDFESAGAFYDYVDFTESLERANKIFKKPN